MNIDTDLFFQAATRKLRFDTPRGPLTAEDLLDLSLKELDIIGRSLRRKISPDGEESLLANPDRKESLEKEGNVLRFEIVKGVILYLEELNRLKRAKSDAAAQRKFLVELREKQKINALESLPLEEIEARIAALDAADA